MNRQPLALHLFASPNELLLLIAALSSAQEFKLRAGAQKIPPELLL